MAALCLLSMLSGLAWLCVLLHPDRPYRPLVADESPLKARPEEPPENTPLVSIIIPARNEADTIAAVLTAHFQSAWPRKEVILVNDQSDDDTEAQARQAAQKAQPAGCAFQLIQSGPLPEGWVGKVNAMAQGVSVARGDYFLFTDADILCEPDLLNRLVAESEAAGLGLNSRMALLACRSFWEKLFVPAFVYFFALLYPFRAVARLGSRKAAAAGGCMLVKKDCLSTAGGLAAIKNAIIDDVALGRLIKDAGPAIRLTLTRKVRSLRRYLALKDFWRTVTRTAFTELHYSWGRLSAVTLVMMLLFAVPPAALAAGAVSLHPTAMAAGAAALLLAALLYAPTVRFYGLSPIYAAVIPIIGLLYLAMTWHSAWGYLMGRRSAWKSREYRV